MPGAAHDPRYRRVRDATKDDVLGYKKHTLVVTKFFQAHGLEAIGWEIWDVAPFHVLNIRKGNPVPVNIMHALDSAIRGREGVSHHFTEANLNPKLLHDASDISHRVFIEKLRTLRRVWFPKAPEPAVTEPASTAASTLASDLASVNLSGADGGSSAIGPFNALSGAVDGSPFCKVSFDTAIELSVVSGGLTRKFAVAPGHVKLVEKTARSANNPFGARENEYLQSDETATRAAATAANRLRGGEKKRKRNVDGEASAKKGKARKKRKLADGQAAPPKKTGSKSKRQEEDPEYTQDSSEPDFDSDGESSTYSLGSSIEESEQTTAEDVATLPIRRSPSLRNQWIVEIGRTNDMTFYDPSGASPSTYIDEKASMRKLRQLLNQNKPLVLTITISGRLREFSGEDLHKLDVHNLESVLGLRTELVR